MNDTTSFIDIGIVEGMSQATGDLIASGAED